MVSQVENPAEKSKNEVLNTESTTPALVIEKANPNGATKDIRVNNKVALETSNSPNEQNSSSKTDSLENSKSTSIKAINEREAAQTIQEGWPVIQTRGRVSSLITIDGKSTKGGHQTLSTLESKAKSLIRSENIKAGSNENGEATTLDGPWTWCEVPGSGMSLWTWYESLDMTCVPGLGVFCPWT